MSTSLKFPCGKIWKGISKAEDVDTNGGKVNMGVKSCGGCQKFTYYNYGTYGYCSGVVSI